MDFCPWSIVAEPSSGFLKSGFFLLLATAKVTREANERHNNLGVHRDTDDGRNYLIPKGFAVRYRRCSG